MKQLGRRSLTYVVTFCGAYAAFVVTTAIDGQRVDIGKDFYAAAAQVIPVVLLAIIVRISSPRDLLVASEKEIEGMRLELLGRVARLRESSESSDATTSYY